MKKFILFGIFAIIALTFSAHAQTAPALINPNGLALDTGTQAVSEGPKTAIIKGTAKTVNLILKTTKISGTIAGAVSWQGSNNGVDWYTISTSSLVDQSGITIYGYKEVDKAFLYYRALITQSGTSSLSYSGTYYTTKGPLNLAGQ